MTSGQIAGQYQGFDDRDEELAAAVQAELSLAWRRREQFGATACVEPSWLILLHLFADSLLDRETSLDQLIVASGAGTKTCVRWIDALIQAGLVLTATSANATTVRMTTDGAVRMQCVFRAGPRSAGEPRTGSAHYSQPGSAR